jgi:16S rRNA (cytosine967-C5)-methyltransferase
VRSDATRHSSTLGLADKVLCDVPCSGLGVIRRKPEIRYKKPETFDLLPDLQYIILCEGGTHVVPGGRLVYSTCTLSPDENEEIAKKFLKNNPSFAAEPLEKGFFAAGAQPCHYVTLFPHLNGTDGFFIARFKKNRQV